MHGHYHLDNVLSIPYNTHDKDSYPRYREKGILGKMAKSLGKSLAAWVPQLDVLTPVAAEHLRIWWGRARRVYPAAGCVMDCKEAGKKPATVSRYLSTIARFHRAAQLFNPCSSEAVQMELKG